MTAAPYFREKQQGHPLQLFKIALEGLDTRLTVSLLSLVYPSFLFLDVTRGRLILRV